MQFTNSETEIAEAITLLDKLIKSNPARTIETIRKYKNKYEIDMFTSFRLKKELQKINEKL
jgi:hypothetical protein